MKYVVLLLAALALSGCGLKQQVVHVNVPDVRVNPAQGPEIIVAPVSDARPTTYLSQFPKTTWSNNVGGVVRSGSGFNLVLGSSTTTHKVHEIIVQALRHMGYRTVTVCAKSCTQLHASVEAFAASMPFSFWRAISMTQHMLAKLSVKVQLQRNDRSANFVVHGNGDNIFQVVSQDNWETALNRAIKDFVSNFKQAMASHERALDSGSQGTPTSQASQ